MNQIILNEKKYAEDCLSNKISDLPNFQTLSILARYFYHIEKQRKKKIAKSLLDYVVMKDPIYEANKKRWSDMIENISANTSKYALNEIDGVRVTVSEMEKIDSLERKQIRRLAFTILCLAKLSNLRNPNNNSWVNISHKDIFKMARISCGVKDRNIKINVLYQNGLIEFAKRNDNLSIRVTFVDDDSPEKLFVTDFRELGYEYMLYSGGNITRCSECNKLIPNNAQHTVRYCSSCSADNKDEKKEIKCVDCGNYFNVRKFNSKSTRCPYCRSIYRRERKRINKRDERNRKRVSPYPSELNSD